MVFLAVTPLPNNTGYQLFIQQAHEIITNLETIESR